MSVAGSGWAPARRGLNVAEGENLNHNDGALRFHDALQVSTMPRSPLQRFGPYVLDTDSGELSRDGRLVRLQPQPYKILVRLLRSPGEVVSRDELRRELWADDTFVDFEQGLNTCIRQIRAALGDDAEAPRFIETLQRRGYRFLAPVRVEERAPAPMAAPPAQGSHRHPSVEARPAATEPGSTTSTASGPAVVRSRSPWSRRAALLLIGAGVLVASVAAGALWRPGAEPLAVRSLLVLPLHDLSAEGDQAYLADGLTEAIIGDLSRIRALRVISRTSAMQYKGTGKRLGEIARELDVEAVVEGSVSVVGQRIRLTAQLVDATRDQPIWSGTYERELADVFGMQRDLARTVASEIRVRMTPQERGLLAADRQVEPEAYRAYLRGRYLWNQRTLRSLSAAVEQFQQAISRDPDYAAAHTALAQAHVLLGDEEFAAMTPTEALGRVREASLRALELDASQAGAWAALADVEYSMARNPSLAGEYFERALTLAPGDATVQHWYAWFLISQGRFDEADAAMAIARDLDPLSPIIMTEAGYPAYFAGRHDDALRQFANALEQDPNFVPAHCALGRAYLQKGQIDDALTAFERAVLLSERATAPLTLLAVAAAHAGDHDRARDLMGELERRAAQDFVPPLIFGLVHSAVGDADRAVGWLTRAVDDRTQASLFLAIMPELDALRGHAGFERLLARLEAERQPLSD